MCLLQLQLDEFEPSLDLSRQPVFCGRMERIPFYEAHHGRSPRERSAVHPTLKKDSR